PHVGLFVAISTINFCTSAGTRGRPRGRDFHFQNTRNPPRCQRISVSGWTTREGVPPVEETREMGKRKTNGVGNAPRLDLSLNVEAELVAEEQILSGNSNRVTESTRAGTSGRRRK